MIIDKNLEQYFAQELNCEVCVFALTLIHVLGL